MDKENFRIELLSAQRDDLEKDTLMLKKEIEELGVEEISVVKEDGASPSGGMGDSITLGMLAIAIVPNLLVALVAFLKDWNLRHQNQHYSIRLKKGDVEFDIQFPRDASEKEIENQVKVIQKQFKKIT